MLPIYFNADELVQEFSLTKEDVRSMMDVTIKELTTGFVERWQEEARRSLKKTSDIYSNSIIAIDEGFAKGAVVLLGFLPNAIESGQSPYDMKIGLLSGPKAKISDKGVRYNTVPFRLATPGALAESSVFSGILPEEVFEAILDKPQNIPVPGGGVRSQGLKLDEIPTQYQAPSQSKISLKDLENKKSSYKRKFSLYQGATRIKDPATNQSRVLTFRRVSDNSDENSWIHPGFIAANIAERALENFDIDNIASSVIDRFLAG
jgi:hypothetical protein